MRTRGPVVAALAVVAVLLLLGSGSPAGASGSCTLSPVACENQLPGNPPSEWDINGSGDASIQGFATDISVNRGQTIHFKIKTPASSYHLDIYRIGYYGGNGARKVATVTPSASLPQSQPACINQSSTGLVDCGNWAESASWDVPADAVSGVYIAKLIRDDTQGASHIIFVVRDDGSHSDLLFQTSDTTWQAYNQYGGNSLYVGSPANRAYKVSYNRPFTTRAYASPSFFFEDEYPMVRWLERNGYDVSYSSALDTERRGGELLGHHAFLSVGHDEYWSAGQRANVEVARDAGVNLAFFSGNSMFWKTRWEPSIDGSGTSYRTLVSYKETKANAKIDPNSAWTGTWRDKRFSPPADGGRPENALQGTLWTVDAYRRDPMTVPAADGQLRFWRNTSVANLPPGQVATMPDGILGHEWDEDVDNGSRPAGLIDMSSTTRTVNLHLIDEGNTYVTGSATHHLTLYRASSGALVFGAGTCQWSWELDDNHDVYGGTAPPADARIQQATVNVLADMYAQPGTLQTNLVPATASTDTVAPTSTITSPAPNTVVDSGSTVTVAGTATDSGGGVVGAVEVSTDGGSTWHPASGRENWTYSWTVGGIGQVTIRSRAVDDSGNIEGAGGTTVTVVICPCSLWNSGTTPNLSSSNDRNSVELGMKFRPDSSGYITGLRFFKGPANTGTHVGSLWTSTGTLLARATFTGETASGWQEVSFDQPVAVTAGTSYVASYHATNGGYAVDLFYFGSAFVNPPLRGVQDGTSDGGNGVYGYNSTPTFPTSSYSSSNYWVDVVFNTTIPPDTRPPTVVSVSPAAGASGSDIATDVSATFSEAVDPATVPGNIELHDVNNAVVPSTVTYDAASRTATLHPTSSLAYASPYSATVRGGSSGVKDLAGNALASDYNWAFTTTALRTCPCSVWPSGSFPQISSSGDHNSVELGVKFRADVSGWVTGIRFYKGSANTGTHVGSLWTGDGTLLARTTFSGETSAGWQQANFDGPVAISAGTTYVASYFAPNGAYSLDPGYFSSASYNNQPLRALKNGLDGSNGVFRYGTSSGFPTDTYGSGNYWVDVVYYTAQPPDNIPPRVNAVTPVGGATDVYSDVSTTATFSEAMNPSSVTSGFELRDNANIVVPATVTYDAPTKTATLRPNGLLVPGMTYTATLHGGAGGVSDVAGNPLAADYRWSFSTKSCPCSLWDSSTTPQILSSTDHNSVELGVKFRSDLAGWVSAIRFYKGSANTGTHVGSLWTADGTLLARTTFSGETGSGWQQATFDAPVAISGGTTYIASYFAPNGSYSLDQGYFSSTGYINQPLRALKNGLDGPNGVFRYGSSSGFPTDTYGSGNYWVDVVFHTTQPPDTIPPRVSSVTPAAGSTSVSTGSNATVTFSEAINPATLAGNITLRDGSNTVVPSSVSYDSATKTATLSPTSPLAYTTTYTATVSGGSGGVKDLAGNALATDYSWSFSTKTCPCSLFADAFVPQIRSTGDNNGVELGVKFRVDAAGSVTGIRFYKGASNTGLHVGSLWATDGTLLARAIFTGETSSGWQSVALGSPVSLTPGTTYIVSYYAPNGGYSVDPAYFASSGLVNAPVRALATGVDGPNGVFLYGSSPAFPTDSYNASNYSVDVLFVPGG